MDVALAATILPYFYPRSPCGERRRLPLPFGRLARHFYPRSPCGERPTAFIDFLAEKHFYPRSPCGERPPHYVRGLHLGHFYPRSPCGERPNIRSSDKKALDFYPRSPCGERQLSACYCLRCNPISIHALLAESDVHLVLRGGQLGNFYPRSPCGERLLQRRPTGCAEKFLSTLSLRRATCYFRVV